MRLLKKAAGVGLLGSVLYPLLPRDKDDKDNQNDSPPNFDEMVKNIDFGSSADRKAKELYGRLYGNQNAQSNSIALLRESGLPDAYTRAQMARGANLEEKQAEFLKAYPQGELSNIRFDNAKDAVLAYRRDPNESFAPVDIPLLPSLTNPREFLRDTAEFLGSDGAEIAGEALATLLPGPIKGGLKAAKLAGRLFGGSVAGSTVAEGIQTLRGTQREELEDIAPRIGLKGAISGVAGAGTEVLVRGAMNLFGKGSFLRNTPLGNLANESAKDLGVPFLPYHLTTDHPWLQRIGQQATVQVPDIERELTARRLETASLLENLRTQIPGDATDSLNNLANAYRKNIISNLEKGLGLKTDSVGKVGSEFKGSISEFEKISQAQVRALYDAATQIEAPIFDLLKLRISAGKILSEDLGSIRIGNVDKKSGIVDSKGDEIISQVSGDRGATSKKSIDLEVRQVLNEISETERLEPRVIGKTTIDPIDQLNQWKMRIGRFTQPAPADGISRLTQSTAKQLYKALNDTLDNPANLNRNPEFAKRWKSATKAARDRFSVLEKVAIARANIEPITYLRQAYGSKAYDKLKNIQMATSINNFKRIQDGYIQYLLEPAQINNLTKTLKELPPEFRSLVLKREDLGALQNLGKQIDRFNNLNLSETFLKRIDFSSQVNKLMSSPDNANIDTLQKIIREGGGLGSKVGKDVQAGVIDNIIENVIETSPPFIIDAKKLNNILDQYTKNGAIELLAPPVVKTLRNLANVETALARKADMGAPLAAGSVAGQVMDFDKQGVFSLMKSKLFSRFLLSPFAQKLISGTGGKQWGMKPGIALTASAISKFIQEDFEETD